MSLRLTGVWQPGTGTEIWHAGLTFAEFGQKAQQLLNEGLRLVAADECGGRFAGIWRPGTGVEYWFSGSVADAAAKDKEHFAQGLRLVSVSVHEGGVLCVWHPGTGTQLWNVGMSLSDFKTLDAKHFSEGLRLVSADEYNGQFAAVWQSGTGAQWWSWGSVDDIAAADKVHFAQGLHIKAIGGHQGRVLAVWRPQSGPQWWKASAELDSYKAADATHVAEGLRMSAIRVLADPSSKNPSMSTWFLIDSQEIDNEDWTEECQGLASDGASWLVVSNNASLKAVHRLSIDFGTHLGQVALPPGAGGHVGAPSFDMKAGLLYVAIEGPTSVWVVNKQLQTVAVTPVPAVDAAQGGHMPWCAINPWNGWLYSSTFDNVDRVYAYDPAKAYALVATLKLGGPPLSNVQGGCFSDNGHLYIASDTSGRIHGYDAVSGAPLGSTAVPYSPGGLDGEEIEGIALGHLIHKNGLHSWVHVMVLDNDITNKDDVFMKHFGMPHPELL